MNRMMLNLGISVFKESWQDNFNMLIKDIFMKEIYQSYFSQKLTIILFLRPSNLGMGDNSSGEKPSLQVICQVP